MPEKLNSHRLKLKSITFTLKYKKFIMMKLGNGVLVQKNIFLFQFFIVCARFFIQFSVLIHKKNNPYSSHSDSS